MDPEILTLALGRHMDSLRNSTDWGILLAMAVMTRVVLGAEDGTFEFLGVETSAFRAYFAAAIIYSLVIFALGIKLLRVAGILAKSGARSSSPDASSNPSHGNALACSVILFPWLLNPFSSYSHFGLSQRSLSFGCVTLVLAWWFGFISLTRLDRILEVEAVSSTASLGRAGLRMLLILLGFWIVWAIWQILLRLSDILRISEDQDQKEYHRSLPLRLWSLAAAQTFGLASYAALAASSLVNMDYYAVVVSLVFYLFLPILAFFCPPKRVIEGTGH